MPPRRSSRSTRASVEPQAQPAKVATTIAANNKRKRSQPPEEKPVGRSRRTPVRTSAPTSSRRTSKKALDPVPDEEEEEEEEGAKEREDNEEHEEHPRPAKKARASESPDLEYTDAEEEQETAKPSRRSGGRRGSNKKVVQDDDGEVQEDEDDEDEYVEEKPKARKTAAAKRGSTRSSGAAAAKAKAPSRSSRASKKAVKVESDEEDVVPATGELDEEERNEEEEEAPKKAKGGRGRGSKGGKEKPASKATKPASARKAQPAADDETDEAHADEPAPTTPPPPPRAQTPAVEEERSLLDDLPISRKPPSTPATMRIEPEEPSGPKARLVIHKMVLINFKSYAGRQEIGPFHKSFSAIVGPNGSGKSNTIDALLFVFGWRATKMRQGKLSELIHNSDKYPDLDDCSVEVHFREIIDLPGSDAYEVVPNSKLVVSRTAYKTNGSKYTINGRISTFTEVRDLLRGRGIDLDHKRFLILQGEVESIAQMKAKAPSEHEDGLLEYLEDIIGTSRFKEPIEEALVEMDKLSEERTLKMNRLRLVEKEKNKLEEKKKEAEEYLRLKNEHVRALSRLWQWYLWKCFENEKLFNKKIEETQAELNEEREGNKEDIEHLENLEKHFIEREKAYEEVQAAAAAAVKELAVHEKQSIGLEEKRKHANGKAKKLKKSLQDDEKGRKEAVRTAEDSAEKIDKETAKLKQLEKDLEKEEKALGEIQDSLKDKTQVFHDQIEAKQKELAPWTQKVNAKEAEVDVATSERDALQNKLDAAKEQLKEAQEGLENLRADHAAKFKESEDLRASQAQLKQDVKSLQKKRENAEAHVQSMRAKASNARQKTEEAKQTQAANTSQGKVLDSLTRLKHAGRISGFHGRLGSLGTIPEKYDVAITTACPSLNNLVVDTVEQGQSCIEYLRKQNVGRASFMVLEKLSSRGIEKIATPENVPRLFDLIRPKDPKFAPAFYKAVTNTLVADNLDQANRIAFGGAKRWRVVTLAGQVIESSGAMSGGGNTVQRGGMSSKLAADAVSPEELRKLERESDVATQELEEAQRALRETEGQLEALQESGPKMDMALEKVALDMQTGEKRITEAEKRLRELKSQSKPDAGDVARISALNAKIASASKELEKLNEQANVINKQIDRLKEKIVEIGGSRLLAQKSKVDGIRLNIGIATEEITKAEVALAKAEKDKKKLDNSIETDSKSLLEAEEQLETIQGQIKETREYVEELTEKVEAAQEAANNSKEDLENLKTELNERREEIQVFKQKEMELTQKLEQLGKEAQENERLLNHWETQHASLKLEEVDEDDEDEERGEGEHALEAEQPPSEERAGLVKQEPDEGNVPEKAEKPRKHAEPMDLYSYEDEELARFSKRELIADAELLDEKLKNAKPDLHALKEYKKREEEFLKRAHDLEETTNARDAQKQKYDNLCKQRLDEFMAGFTAISLKLKEMYQMITLGGNAELELVDNMDPFSEGVIFSVMPPKKSWKNISHLSGGEKTLSSLALVFALHHFKPTPLYFMDEIDAALDFRNVSIVANYIKDRTKNAQFIIISLRNDMFELSQRLIGIYKTSNQTRSISIDNRALTAVPVNAVSLSSVPSSAVPSSAVAISAVGA